MLSTSTFEKVNKYKQKKALEFIMTGGKKKKW